MNSFITYNVIMHLICVVIDLDLQPCMFLQFTSTWSQMLAVHREFCLLHLISYCVHHFQYVFHKKFHKGQNQYGPKCQWTRAQSKTLCFLLISNTCDYWNELKYPVASIYHTHTTFKQNQIQYMAPTDGQKHYCWMFDKADKIIYANHRRQMQRGVILNSSPWRVLPVSPRCLWDPGRTADPELAGHLPPHEGGAAWRFYHLWPAQEKTNTYRHPGDWLTNQHWISWITYRCQWS